jgi:hypothetical protein
MRNLGEYLAGRYCSHMKEIARESNVQYSKGMFEVDSYESNSFSALGGYVVRFKDEGNYLRVTFNGQETDVGALKEKIGKLNVPTKYRNIFSSLKVEEKDKKLCVDARFVPHDNASGRYQQDEDKIYYSVRNSIVKPVFKAIMEK